MKTPVTAALIAVPLAVASFLLGPVLWPMAEGGVQPTGAQIALLIGIGVIESIAFGLGIAFLVLAWPWVKKVAHGSRRTAWLLYIATTWYLISWWPHDRLHMHINHDDMWALIGIEYGFHFTLVLAGLAIAYSFFDIMRWYESHSLAAKKA
jgi:hypothetical protein